MADEQESIAAPMPELVTPAIAAPADIETDDDTTLEQPVDTDPGDEEVAGDNDDSGQPEAIEYVTLERNGKQFQVPKELEGEFLMQGDYTKKTQTVAERAKELDAREQRIAQQAEASEAELDARAKLRSVTEQLAAYEKLTTEDWNAHELNDPIGTRQHERAFQALKAQKAELEGNLSKAGAERTEKAQQDLAKRVQETLEAAPKIIPGLTPETRAATIEKLLAHAHSKGIPEQVIKANWSPTFLGLLYEAHIGAQAIAKQSAPKPAANTPAIAPLATVKAQASPAPSRSVADLAKGGDMAAYAAARAAGRKR
jgi:hypothetical protein